jgi:xylan 1,4-beta-xylosidase
MQTGIFAVMKPLLILAALGAMCWQSNAQPSAQRTYCNPLDVDYRYNFERYEGHSSYRSGADPVIVNHRGEYYLFVTNSGGWWHSKDLGAWKFVKPSIWPEGDICAPAVAVVRDTLYLFQSTFEFRPVYMSANPRSGKLAEFTHQLPPLQGALGPWDPDIFHDEQTDRWFMYFGSSNEYPLYGIELDHSQELSYIGEAKPLILLDPETHGWERFGQDHRETRAPFVEGAWMTKHKGRYYLQYAAPGTEYNVYANGAYLGDDPLGPFTYASYNPVSYKPGGFVTGAGHGNTFQDNFGNYWNTGTPWVGVNWNFERRIAMFPAGFDSDGQMFSNTRFGDFPHYLPTHKWSQKNALFTGWMLLSYGRPCRASSVKDTFATSRVTDENPRTFWVAERNAPGEWLTIDLGHACQVRAVQVNFADYDSDIYVNDSTVYTLFRISESLDGRRWRVLSDLTRQKRDRPNAYIELKSFCWTRYLRYEHVFARTTNLAISDFRVFGKGPGRPPAKPGGLEVRRDTDARNAFVSWDPVLDAVGYNVLWGVKPGKLYQTYQVFAEGGTLLELRALTVGQEYYFSVEAFNDSGVSPASPPVQCR